MRKLFTLISITLVTAALLSPIAQGADNPPRKILSGWIPYYSMKTALPDALNNSDLVKEVMPFWYTLKFDSKAKTAYVSDLTNTGKDPITKLSESETAIIAFKQKEFNVIPTITDGTGKLVLAGLLKSPASRTQIITSILSLVTSNNYDGIDLDFEGFAFIDGNTTWASTAPLWVAFVKELSIALHAQNKILSISTPYVLNPNDAQKGYYVYSWAAIASSIDKLRIMTYDYSVSKAGPLGPITWAERTVQYAISIMPASKVFVGVPGYGRDWVTAVSGICPSDVAGAVKVGAKAATFVMRDASVLASTYGATPTYNSQYGEMTFSYQKVYNGTTSGLATSCTASRTAWYQDAKSWALRAALVTKYRIGGIAAWTFGMEEPLAMESIRQVATEIAPDQVNVIASIDKTTVDYGNPITVSGTLTIKDKSPVANVTVRIEGKSGTESSYRLLATATTGADGSFQKPLIVGRTTAIRIHSDATWERSEGISSDSVLAVNRVLTLNAPATVKSGNPILISGDVRPRIAGNYLQIQSLVAGVWKPLGEAVVTDAQGAFAVNISGQPRSILTLRASVAADALWTVVTSPTFNIIIR